MAAHQDHQPPPATYPNLCTTDATDSVAPHETLATIAVLAQTSAAHPAIDLAAFRPATRLFGP
jgi:hypothetical protein